MRTYNASVQTQEAPFVAHFASVIGMPGNIVRAKRILTAFLQTIRERIPLFASKALIAHLPNDIKPLIKEHWNRQFSTKFDYNEFIDALCETKGMEHFNLFYSKKEAETAVSAVFEVIKERESCHRYADLMSLMPLCLRMNILNEYFFDVHGQIV